jgi:hypothetical protein
MKPCFFLITLCFFINSQGAFSQAVTTKPQSELYYPAIEISAQLSQQIFVDKTQKVINCPILFDNSWDYPNGSSIALCDDAQLACLRYGVLVQKIKTATGALLEELKKTLVLQKDEVKLRLRGCQLMLEATVSGEKTLQEAAGYPSDTYGPTGQ